ncbi:MAG: 2-amino-4-hydroxy-6-hydroxymethyldihydropteridine diphosphokinase [Paraglaciecola sp.]|nr:2-amino-4-hydroxy-6-hydroxymethyldihydropteridine diphosphokinase [Paraglaciecola sp.]NCT49396.1 2-amino-4-hydroxy-6-hydroxymethyldihydropteridine diphosphokinase [Paraglaciecola sp.]
MRSDSEHAHRIFISVGSNIDKEKYTRAAILELGQVFESLVLSQVYESEAVGFVGQNFYNLVVKATTTASIEAVCQILKNIEDKHKRQRGTEKFSPRTLDLDLLLYDAVVCQSPVELPRGEILYNAFVLQPLAEIAPSDKHPLVHQSYQQLWQQYDKSQQQLWPIAFDWSPEHP